MKVKLETIGEVSDAHYLAAIIQQDIRNAKRMINDREERLLRIFAAALAAGIAKATREGHDQGTLFVEVDMDQPLATLRPDLERAFRPVAERAAGEPCNCGPCSLARASGTLD